MFEIPGNNNVTSAYYSGGYVLAVIETLLFQDTGASCWSR
jgi:hypothetical protein